MLINKSDEKDTYLLFIRSYLLCLCNQRTVPRWKVDDTEVTDNIVVAKAFNI